MTHADNSPLGAGGSSDIDELLDQAIEAIGRGDRATADALASQVLSADESNTDAEDLLAPPVGNGEIRRLTIMFADLVDSTALSTKVDPETYRTVVGRYKDRVRRIIDKYEGHIASIKGDGLLTVFGHPVPHENDALRAVRAGLEICQDVAELNERARERFGIGINVRVGVHRGVVYLDTEQDDVYGFAANLAARVSGLAQPGTVAVSTAVQRLVADMFQLEALPAEHVKGVEEPVAYFRVGSERDATRVPQGPFVGRHSEITYIESSWAAATAGALAVPAIAVHGEAGIGKSRLAGFAVNLAERAGAEVIELIGSAFHTDVGLYPVRRLLERRSGISRHAQADQRLRLLSAEIAKRPSLDATTTVPLLAAVLGIDPQAGYQAVDAEGKALHERITGAVLAYLIACMGEHPALVLAEDLHWFDESTLGLVHALLGRATGRVMIVTTSREPDTLPSGPLVHDMELTPLADDDTDLLIVALHPRMPSNARAAVRRRCNGVPLFVEEVVTKFRDDEGAAAVAQVPDTLYEALFARLHAGEQENEAVEAAAMIGSQFARPLLQSVLSITDDEIDRVLANLRDSMVLERAGDDTWRFRHELLRELAAELPPPNKQRALHSRIADALKSIAAEGDQDWPLIALHFEQANRFAEATSAYHQASSAARRRGSLEEARRYLSRALDQLRNMPAGRERDRQEIALRLRRGFLASAAKGSGNRQTAADFERCLQLAGNDVAEDDLFRTLSATFLHYFNRADIQRAHAVVNLLRIGVEDRLQWFRAENIAGTGMLQLISGELEAARERLEEVAALATAREHQDLEPSWFIPWDPVVAELTMLAEARWMLGDLPGADAALADSRQRADGLGFPQGPFSLCYEEFMEIRMAIEAGRLEHAAELASALTVRAQRHGFDQWHAVGTVMQSAVAALISTHEGNTSSKRVSDGIALLTGWVEACRYLEVNVFIPSFDGMTARLLIAAGQFEEARARLNAGLRLADQTGMHYYDAELLRLRSRTREDSSESRSDLDTAIKIATEQHAVIFELRCAIDDFASRGDAARGTVEKALKKLSPDSAQPEADEARAILDG